MFVGNCLFFLHDFSVQLRTGFNPIDINQFQSQLEKPILLKTKNANVLNTNKYKVNAKHLYNQSSPKFQY